MNINQRREFDLRRTISVVLLCISLICILAMIIYTVKSKESYEKGVETYDSIRVGAVSTVSNNENISAVSDDNSSITDYQAADPRGDWFKDTDGQNAYYMHIELSYLEEQNEDFCAWIYGCGGAINYPVVESDDPKYYLKHDFLKQYDTMGCLYVTTLENTFINSDTTIYGHNMRRGDSMFHCLVDYMEEDYYYEHPSFYIFSEDGDERYEIFSAYRMSVYDLNSAQEAANLMTRSEYISDLISRSIYDTGVEVDDDDVILTLVACEYTTYNSRMIIHARRVN